MNLPNDTVLETSRNLPVSGRYDVVIAGGGIAGISAAVAAARAGRSVCLLEKTCGVGGLATLGNVTMWLPLCDGLGNQVVGGIPEELIKLSVADLGKDHPAARFVGIPKCWRPGGNHEERKSVRYKASFNPASYLLALEKFLLDENVTLLYDTIVCAAVRDGDWISHLIVENKSGRSAVACQVVIDATGDADVCFLAGEPTESLDTNVLSGWFYYLDANDLTLNTLSRHYSPFATKDGAEGPFLRGDVATQVTAQIVGTRELIRNRLRELSHPEGNVHIVSLPSVACFRMTRRLVGDFSLGERHIHQWFDDAIGLTGDWRKSGPVYAIPWRSLHGVINRNLASAGRCISVDTTAWDVTRAIPTCALTGAAAGAAAALAIENTEGDLHAIDIVELQRSLTEQGFYLDAKLVES